MPELERSVDVLLVGGGVASVRCARAMRRNGFDGSILLVGDEERPPYNRPPLSKELLRLDLPDDLVDAEPDAWYRRRSIDVMTGTMPSCTLEPEGRSAVLADGDTIRFGRCLLATGAEPRRLSIPGAEQAMLLRTLSDARGLRSAATSMERGATAAVIGGGFIGLEVASGLAELGLRPIVLEQAERLWGGRLGRLLETWAVERLRSAGIEVRFGAEVTRIDPGSIHVGDERIEVGLAVAGIGVLPRSDLAASAGLETDDGVVVDAGGRTSHPAIWAAGDVARYGPLRVEHWHAARESGERAGLSMLGLPLPDVPPPWVFTEVVGMAVDIVGDAAEWDDEQWLIPDRLLVHTEAGRVVRIISIGSEMPAGVLREVVAARESTESVSARAARLNRQ